MGTFGVSKRALVIKGSSRTTLFVIRRPYGGVKSSHRLSLGELSQGGMRFARRQNCKGEARFQYNGLD